MCITIILPILLKFKYDLPKNIQIHGTAIFAYIKDNDDALTFSEVSKMIKNNEIIYQIKHYFRRCHEQKNSFDASLLS